MHVVDCTPRADYILQISSLEEVLTAAVLASVA